MLQHQHNLNRSAEADAQYAPIAARANMIAAPVRALGYFGGPVGAGYAEAKAQQIEQAGGARSGYDPMAIAEQTLVPMAVNASAKLARSLRRPPPGAPPSPPPLIGPVPQPQLKPTVKGSYFGPERRQSVLSPTQAAEEQIGRMSQRRRSTDPLEGFTEGSYYRVTGNDSRLGDFIDTMDRTRRKP